MKPAEAEPDIKTESTKKRELPGAMGYMSNPPIIAPKKRRKTVSWRGDSFK